MTPSDSNKRTTVPFIVFSDDWGIHPSSSQHLFKHIIPHHSVAWINTIGMRRPKLTMSDLSKATRKLGNMLRRPAPDLAHSQNYNLEIFQPKMIPFNDIGFVRYLNKRSVKNTLDQIQQQLAGEPPIIVTSVPNACDFVDLIPSRKIVYYCVDDFSEWPGLDKSLINEMERKLIGKADEFIATSPALRDRLAQTGKPTTLLPHGVDTDLFASESEMELTILNGISRPRAAYFGLFDERSDQQLIADVADTLPDVSIVIAGKVETSVGRLRNRKNVHFIGPIAYDKLPQLIKGVDILFIPYIVNALTDALSPLKFKEYIASGLPILTTPISAAADFQNYVHISARAEDWQRYIRASLGEPRGLRKPEMLESLRGESWNDKASKFLDLCLS